MTSNDVHMFVVAFTITAQGDFDYCLLRKSAHLIALFTKENSPKVPALLSKHLVLSPGVHLPAIFSEAN